eukprot:Gb_00689 [translate_table: standard]
MEGKLRLQQKHGKARVRVARVWRQPGNTIIVEWNVSIMLYSDCIPAYTDGDNSDIVATDSMKNTGWTHHYLSTRSVAMELPRNPSLLGLCTCWAGPSPCTP